MSARSRARLSGVCRAIGASGGWGAWARGDADQPFSRTRARPDGLDAVWTYSAVTAIAEAVARMPRRLIDGAGEIVDAGPLNLLLSRPNSGQTGRDLVELLVMRLLGASGAVAIIKHFDAPGAALPTKLFVADAQRLRPIFAPARPHRMVTGWVYTAPDGGGQIPFEAGDIITIRLPGAAGMSPLDGLSPQVAARRAIELDREMGRYAGDFFRSDATPGTVLSTDRPLTRMQVRDTVRDWDSRHGGRAHRTAVLHKGLKPIAAPTIKDLAFTDLARATRESQSAVYNVPPIVLGIVEDANRANSDAQMAMFLLGPVLSIADRVITALNVGLVSVHPWPDRATAPAQRLSMSRSRMVAIAEERALCAQIQRERRCLRSALDRAGSPEARMTGAPASEGLTLIADADSHPTIIAMKLERGAPSAKLIHDMGQPLNDLLDLLDLPLPRTTTGDVALLPFSLAPADAIAGPLTGGENPPPAPAQKQAPNPQESLKVRDGFDAVRRAALRGVRERHERTFVPLMRVMEREIKRHLSDQIDGLLDRLTREIAPEDLAQRDARAPAEGFVDRILFNVSEEAGKVRARTEAVRAKTAELGASQGAHESGLSVAEAAQQAPILVESPGVQLVLRKSKAVFTLIEGDRASAARRIIMSAFEGEGNTFNELVQNLKGLYDGSFTAARRTALTETTKVLNGARHESGKAVGATAKLWLTTSGNVRPTHRAAEAEFGSTPIPIGEPFQVGAGRLMYPADPDGPLAEIINCHCVQLFTFLDEGDGGGDGRAALDRVIARYERRGFVTLDDLQTPPTESSHAA